MPELSPLPSLNPSFPAQTGSAWPALPQTQQAVDLSLYQPQRLPHPRPPLGLPSPSRDSYQKSGPPTANLPSPLRLRRSSPTRNLTAPSMLSPTLESEVNEVAESVAQLSPQNNDNATSKLKRAVKKQVRQVFEEHPAYASFAETHPRLNKTLLFGTAAGLVLGVPALLKFAWHSLLRHGGGRLIQWLDRAQLNLPGGLKLPLFNGRLTRLKDTITPRSPKDAFLKFGLILMGLTGGSLMMEAAYRHPLPSMHQSLTQGTLLTESAEGQPAPDPRAIPAQVIA